VLLGLRLAGEGYLILNVVPLGDSLAEKRLEFFSIE
jgi:hypothetical protein